MTAFLLMIYGPVKFNFIVFHEHGFHVFLGSFYVCNDNFELVQFLDIKGTLCSFLRQLSVCNVNFLVGFFCFFVFLQKTWQSQYWIHFLDSGIHLEVNILNVILISKDE